MPRAKGLEDGQPVQAFVFGLANVTVENRPYSSGSEATLSTRNGIQSFVRPRTHFPRLICD